MSSYPRHSSQKSAEGLGDFVEAVSDLNQHRQGRKVGSRDNGWKGQKRNALDNIKNSEDLNAALSYLLEEQHTILETCQGELESILMNSHVEEDKATHVVTNSLALRIGRDTLLSFISLMNHLSATNNTRGWGICDSHRKYHAEKMGRIRAKYRNRIQMICRMYTYLREGQSSNWMSMKLQNAELITLRTQMTNQGGDGGSQGYSCSHCKSALHGGGRGACPWKEKTPAEAKKAATAVLVSLAAGNVTPPVAEG